MIGRDSSLVILIPLSFSTNNAFTKAPGVCVVAITRVVLAGICSGTSTGFWATTIKRLWFSFWLARFDSMACKPYNLPPASLPIAATSSRFSSFTMSIAAEVLSAGLTSISVRFAKKCEHWENTCGCAYNTLILLISVLLVSLLATNSACLIGCVSSPIILKRVCCSWS